MTLPSLSRHWASAAFIAAVAIATAAVFVVDGTAGHPAVVATFLCVIALCAAGVVTDPRPWGLSQMFYIFTLVFLGLAPLSQHLAGEGLWEPAPFTPAQCLRANALVILCCAAFFLGGLLVSKKRQPAHEKPADQRHAGQRPETPAPPIRPIPLLILSAAATALTVWIFRDYLMALVYRFDFDIFTIGQPVIEFLAVNYILRSLPMMCLLVALAGSGASLWQKVALAALAVAAAMPTALPRQQVAALYLPALMLAAPWLRGDKRLSLCMFAAILVVFPAMTALRGHENTMFRNIDFDAYMLLCRVVDRGYVTYGWQLLGVLLFFVPRGLWAAKPVASGYYVSALEQYSYDNLSMPLLAEGYLNFGYAGALAFAFAAGAGARWCDSRQRTLSAPALTAYLLIVGYAIFLLRGPLMSAFGMLCCTLLALAIAWLPARTRTRLKKA